MSVLWYVTFVGSWFDDMGRWCMCKRVRVTHVTKDRQSCSNHYHSMWGKITMLIKMAIVVLLSFVCLLLPYRSHTHKRVSSMLYHCIRLVFSVKVTCVPSLLSLSTSEFQSVDYTSLDLTTKDNVTLARFLVLFAPLDPIKPNACLQYANCPQKEKNKRNGSLLEWAISTCDSSISVRKSVKLLFRWKPWLSQRY